MTQNIAACCAEFHSTVSAQKKILRLEKTIEGLRHELVNARAVIGLYGEIIDRDKLRIKRIKQRRPTAG